MEHQYIRRKNPLSAYQWLFWNSISYQVLQSCGTGQVLVPQSAVSYSAVCLHGKTTLLTQADCTGANKPVIKYILYI